MSVILSLDIYMITEAPISSQTGEIPFEIFWPRGAAPADIPAPVTGAEGAACSMSRKPQFDTTDQLRNLGADYNRSVARGPLCSQISGRNIVNKRNTSSPAPTVVNVSENGARKAEEKTPASAGA